MNGDELFVRLCHGLGAYDDALLLAALVARGATEGPVNSTVTKLSEVCLGGRLNRQQVHRASVRLAARGLLRMRVYPHTYTEYSVPPEALRALLVLPLPQVALLSGDAERPISFLTRMQADPSRLASSCASALRSTSSEEIQ